MNQLTPEQQRLSDALQSFPDKITEESLDWPEGYKLYEALRNLGDAILKAPGRFLYNDISTLRQDDFYLLGINPGGKPEIENTPLFEEIRSWSQKSTHAIAVEGWNTTYQRTVEALCSAVGKELRELCSSNLYFIRTPGTDLLDATLSQLRADFRVFWPVHEAVLDIVKPKCIFVFGADVFSKIIQLMLNSKEKPLLKYKSRPLLPKYKGGCNCSVGEGERLGSPMKVIGMPYPKYGRQLTSQPMVLQKIAEECRASTAKP